MSVVAYYYLILTVYVLILICELLVCHLTHSLVILTDSYINLYAILQISTFISHSKKQKQSQPDNNANSYCTKILGRTSTYKLNRLPVIGAFINGLFLAALLMSVAIEGIQTCFHVGHLRGADEKTIITQHQATYPLILVSLAVVGALVQFCTKLVRDKEANEALVAAHSLQIPTAASKTGGKLNELNVSGLQSATITMNYIDRSNCASPAAIGYSSDQLLAANFKALRERSEDCRRNKLRAPVVLKSLKVSVPVSCTKSNSDKLIEFRQSQAKDAPARAGGLWHWHELLRAYCSPVALLICFAMVCLFDDEFITEISDASLAISVVVLMFFGIYPPIKVASKVLLQSVPAHVDLDGLRAHILRENPAAILNLHSLHIWSLSGEDKAVGTCHLIVDSSLIKSTRDLDKIIKQTRVIFALHNVGCITIQVEFDKQMQDTNSKDKDADEDNDCQLACCVLSKLNNIAVAFSTDNVDQDHEHGHSHKHGHDHHDHDHHQHSTSMA